MVLDASGVSGTYKVSVVSSNVEPTSMLSSGDLRNQRRKWWSFHLVFVECA
jgi:hypothetical protein